ncbi:hypothetical protein JCM16138_13180 [Thermococcus atlanticus]
MWGILWWSRRLWGIFGLLGNRGCSRLNLSRLWRSGDVLRMGLFRLLWILWCLWSARRELWWEFVSANYNKNQTTKCKNQ